MRLQKLCELTTLPKRTIHFYIEEHLITPKKDPNNGYYDFIDEDVEKLRVIAIFRKTGISIQNIKEVFRYPTLTNFFLHRQIHVIKNNINKELDQLNFISCILDNIPPNATPVSLNKKHLQKNYYKNNLLDSYFPNIDARMIAIIIWAPFLEVEGNEYREFLWNKIHTELKLMFDTNLVYLQRLIYILSAEQIINISAFNFKIYRDIINTEETKYFEDLLYTKCQNLISDKSLQTYWLKLYENILTPTRNFYTGNTHRLMIEYNERYNLWLCKMEIIIKNTFNHISENKEMCKQLKTIFNDKLNLSPELFSDLLLILTFDNSIFTVFPLAKITSEILIPKNNHDN